MKRKLSEGDIAKIKELYDGTFKSIQALAKTYNVNPSTIMWKVNYKGRREQMKEYTSRWKEKHKDRFLAKQKEYYQNNKVRLCEMARANSKKRYWANPDKYRERSRNNYYKNKI